jgi:hypothetical protein
MTQDLLSYLMGCNKDFQTYINEHILDRNPKKQQSEAYYKFIDCLKQTPFYTNEWPEVGQPWWY